MNDEERQPASFLTLAPATRVVDCFGQPVGRVERVLVAAGSYFDGLIVCTEAGRRFVDAPEVGAIRPDLVRLKTARHDVEHPGEPRVLGAHSARRARDELLPEYREAAIEGLKHAYVHDLLTTDELAQAVEDAHRVTTLAELEALVPRDG